MSRIHSKRVGGLATLVAVLVFVPLGLPGAARSSPGAPTIQSSDIGLDTAFQDTQFGHFQRGRALIAADFDLDGRLDFYVGNPGDESYVIRNVADSGSAFHFEFVQVLLTDVIAWGANSADYDNDGDYDIFVTVGANENLGPPGDGIGFNYMFQNLWMESGQTNLSFRDVTDFAGVAGPVPPGSSDPIPIAGAGAVAGDYDRDGWIDIFESVNVNDDSLPDLKGRNILWHNDGDGTFTDVTDEVGLGVTRLRTRHSTFIDIDNDGDLDLYENNFLDPNYLWRNRLVEDGVATFEDVTAQFSPPGENVACPEESFGSTATDFNNDGWQDLIVFDRYQDGEPSYCPYPVGNAIFINQGGTGFVNVGPASGVNNQFVWDKGVMGCQVGDLNGDGSPDVYVGNGAPMDTNSANGGQHDRLYLSAQPPGQLPTFRNNTSLIDFPAPRNGTSRYPPYPYRTHGTSIVDVDGDGTQELAVTEGGPAASPDSVREPDRLFKFVVTPTPNWFIVHPVGDGVTVSRDAIGTRFALTVKTSGGRTWTLRGTLFGGSCFSANNGFDVYFGLANANSILSLEIDWPDGTVETRTTGLPINTRIVVSRSNMQGTAARRPLQARSDAPNQLAALFAAHPRPSRAEFVRYPLTSLRIRCEQG